MPQSLPRPAASYVERIARVQDFIRAHLDDELSLDTLADVACFSRFHWHRVYRAMTGETAADTVRRLRLARAAYDLAFTNMTFAIIAARAGYSSEPAFARAFTAAYRASPHAFRTRGLHTELQLAQSEDNAMAFPVEIKTIARRPALCLPHKGHYQNIGATFERLSLQLGAEGLMRHVRGPLGVYFDDPHTVDAAALRGFACFYVDDAEVRSKIAEMHEWGGGRYAVMHYRGPYTAMPPAYDWLFGTWLPQSGRVLRDAPILEINLNTPLDTAPADLLTDICAPLED